MATLGWCTSIDLVGDGFTVRRVRLLPHTTISASAAVCDQKRCQDGENRTPVARFQSGMSATDLHPDVTTIRTAPSLAKGVNSPATAQTG